MITDINTILFENEIESKVAIPPQLETLMLDATRKEVTAHISKGDPLQFFAEKLPTRAMDDSAILTRVVYNAPSNQVEAEATWDLSSLPSGGYIECLRIGFKMADGKYQMAAASVSLNANPKSGNTLIVDLTVRHPLLKEGLLEVLLVLVTAQGNIPLIKSQPFSL